MRVSFFVRAVVFAAVVAVVAPLTAWADSSSTTPVSGPPNPAVPSPPSCRQIGGCQAGSFSISPRRGPTGTQIASNGVCGARTYPPGAAAVLSEQGFSVANPFMTNASLLLVVASTGSGAPPSAFTATIVANEPPGYYFVTGMCCIDPGCGSGPITPSQIRYLPSRLFCVTGPDDPCDLSWSLYAYGFLGGRNLFAQNFIDQIAIRFAAPASPSPPPPPPTDTTPTTRASGAPQNRPQSNPPQTSPPPPTPTTCTTSYVKPPMTTCGP